ncbi:hypothetical protein [Paenarthrobacter ureafaciens]|uniref:hypothetical protein n=1 Tax=Paenarthrobacter ureafaciens TaxID=37931 RepID=UPI001FB3A0CF|nr:hypothetical protein [Paenarthrobacter ureafaciens]UOD81052.1 hypothetical protein MQZ73_18410 [Paenarthrobacter ureafaciens]WNZ03711.1 hypothetical protein PVT25_19065 [Paenarthrobacter ureafaciens]
MGERLTVELEDLGSTSWWAGILTVLTSQYGSRLLRFAARANGRSLYTSDTFTSPRSYRDGPPEEAYSPGMRQALDRLLEDLARDGWEQTGRGEHPWSFVFERDQRQGL